VSDENIEDADEPMSARAKWTAGLIGAMVLLGAGFVLLRISSPAILPAQAPPAGHYPLDCGLCHSFSDSAKPIGVS
jgi:hypothetical protein